MKLALNKTQSSSIWSKDFILLMIANALLFMMFEMLLPTLPLFVESIGGSPSQIGLVTGVFMLSAIIIRPFSSTLLRYFHKKHLLLVGVLICMTATALYPFSGTLVALLLFRLLHGFGFGVATTMFATAASEQLPMKKMGEGMGYFGVGETIAISLGPLVGIWMLQHFDYTGLFLTGALILLMSAFMTLILSNSNAANSEDVVNQSKSKKFQDEGQRFKWVESRVLLQGMLILLIGVVAGGVMSFITLFAKERGLNNAAWFFFVVAITSLLIRLVSGKIFDTKGPVVILVPSGISIIIAIASIAYAETEIQLLIAAIFYGIGFGSVFPAIQAWAISAVDEASREDAVATFFNCFDLGIGGGSLLLGMIAGATSYQSMYLISIILVVVYMAITLGYSLRSRKRVQNQ